MLPARGGGACRRARGGLRGGGQLQGPGGVAGAGTPAALARRGARPPSFQLAPLCPRAAPLPTPYSPHQRVADEALAALDNASLVGEPAMPEDAAGGGLGGAGAGGAGGMYGAQGGGIFMGM